MTPEAAGSNSSVQPAAASLASVAEFDDLQLEAGFLGDAAAEFFAVLCGAAGLGGNEPGAPHTAGAHLITTDQERLDSAFDRRLTDAARRGDPFPQANDARERVDHAKSLGGRTRDQQPAVVGAEIKGGVGPVGMAAGERLVIVAANALATDPVWRTARPAPPGRSTTVEAAGRRSLLLHSIPSCRAGTLLLDDRGPRSSSNHAKCISRRRQGQYCAFPAYEPCARLACRAAPSPLCHHI